MSNNKSILIVDDEPNILELLRVNFSSRGYFVNTVNNGNVAIEYLNFNKPDLVILDVMMPELDGWEVCKFIRDNPDTAETIVIMLTAKDTPKDKMIGLNILKATKYVTKPFDIEKLAIMVEELLNVK